MTFCCTLAAVLATTISSSCITNFMTLPPWMPTSVESSDTFGSSDHEYTRVTSNTLAAVESIFDAYYERVYYKSAGGVDDRQWSTNYGPCDFHTMDFTNGAQTAIFEYSNNYRGVSNAWDIGTRVVTNTSRIVEWPNILQLDGDHPYLHSLVDSHGQMIVRDTWNKAATDELYTCSWSTSLFDSGRTPPDYDWTTQPATSVYESSKPIFALMTDQYLHTGSYGDFKYNYPVPRLFWMADGYWYQYCVEDRIPELMIYETLPSLIDSAFSIDSMSTEHGLEDISRRWKPDQYVDKNDLHCSSLLATDSRLLSVLDRTYEIPPFVSYGSVSNVSRYSERSVSFDFVGTIRNVQIMFTDAAQGDFSCNMITDADLHLDRTYNDTTNRVVSYSSNCNQARDKARFEGTSTSIDQVCTLEMFALDIGSVGDFIGEVVDFQGVVVGTNHVNLIPKSQNNVALVEMRSGPEDCYFLRNFSVLIPPIEVKMTEIVTLSRSCETSYTMPADVPVVKRVLPIPVPCKSAFESGRVSSATASMFRYLVDITSSSMGSAYSIDVDLSWLQEPYDAVIKTSIQNIPLSDERSLWNSYLSQRSSTRSKVLSLVPHLDDPDYYTGQVNRSYIDTTSPGSYVNIDGGGFQAVYFIDNTPFSGTNFAALIEDYLGVTYVKKLGYYYGDSIVWFDNFSRIIVVLSLDPDDEGSGYLLSPSVSDFSPKSADAMVIPMVTTDWNWNALKMSR